MVGVLHRDIVPENVIVDMNAASGRMVYKICGFGMSKPAAQADRDDSGPLASASPYRAPELFLGSKDYDGRVDTWSLGCIMAELVAGNGVPFFCAPDGEVFKKMLQSGWHRGHHRVAGAGARGAGRKGGLPSKDGQRGGRSPAAAGGVPAGGSVSGWVQGFGRTAG